MRISSIINDVNMMSAMDFRKEVFPELHKVIEALTVELSDSEIMKLVSASLMTLHDEEGIERFVCPESYEIQSVRIREKSDCSLEQFRKMVYSSGVPYTFNTSGHLLSGDGYCVQSYENVVDPPPIWSGLHRELEEIAKNNIDASPIGNTSKFMFDPYSNSVVKGGIKVGVEEIIMKLMPAGRSRNDGLYYGGLDCPLATRNEYLISDIIFQLRKMRQKDKDVEILLMEHGRVRDVRLARVMEKLNVCVDYDDPRFRKFDPRYVSRTEDGKLDVRVLVSPFSPPLVRNFPGKSRKESADLSQIYRYMKLRSRFSSVVVPIKVSPSFLMSDGAMTNLNFGDDAKLMANKSGSYIPGTYFRPIVPHRPFFYLTNVRQRGFRKFKFKICKVVIARMSYMTRVRTYCIQTGKLMHLPPGALEYNPDHWESKANFRRLASVLINFRELFPKAFKYENVYREGMGLQRILYAKFKKSDQMLEDNFTPSWKTLFRTVVDTFKLKVNIEENPKKSCISGYELNSLGISRTDIDTFVTSGLLSVSKTGGSQMYFLTRVGLRYQLEEKFEPQDIPVPLTECSNGDDCGCQNHMMRNRILDEIRDDSVTTYTENVYFNGRDPRKMAPAQIRELLDARLQIVRKLPASPKVVPKKIKRRNNGGSVYVRKNV